MPSTRFAIALISASCLARAAAADVCVVVDESRDTLEADDRRGALVTFEQALAKNNLHVTPDNCTATYTLYNVKLGGTITAYVDGPTGTIQGRTYQLAGLPGIYEQMAHSLATGEPMGSDRNYDRGDVVRAYAEDVKYVRLGYGISGRAASGGPAFGFGLRHELNRVAVQLSVLDLVVPTGGSPNGDLARISMFWYQHLLANDTTYAGAGIGWGWSSLNDGTMNYSGNGLQGTLTAGYEFLRATNVRMIVELDATLPIYTSTASMTGTQRWVPTALLSVGFGIR